MLGSLLRRSFDAVGFTIYRSSVLPRGLDQYLDLAQLEPPLKVQTAFDIGANVGQTAHRLAGQFPHCRIHRFEPIPATFQKLRANVASLPNVQCHPFALGAAKAKATAYVSANNSELASLNRPTDIEISSTEQIEVDTVDAFCEQNRIEHIDILKTDTEGYDAEVLRGAQATLDRRGISAVVAECTFDPADARHTNFFVLHEMLASRGFPFFGLYEPYHHENRLLFANAVFKMA